MLIEPRDNRIRNRQAAGSGNAWQGAGAVWGVVAITDHSPIAICISYHLFVTL